MKRHLNLIPLNLRIRQLLLSQFRRWLLVCMASVALCCAVLQSHKSQFAELEPSVKRLDSRCVELRSLAQETAQSRVEIQQLRDQAAWLNSLEQSDVPLLALAAIAQSVSPLTSQLQLDRLQMEKLSAPAPTNTPSGKTPAMDATAVPKPVMVHDRLDVSGTAASDTAVRSLLARLESTGLFDSVELVSLQSGGQSRRAFQVHCVLFSEFRNVKAVNTQESFNFNKTASLTRSGNAR